MRCFPILVLLFTFHCARSQDTITLSNDSLLKGKVTEISSREIKYKAADNPDGPVYILRRSQVKKITYANGKAEFIIARSERDDIFMNEDMARHSFSFELGGNAGKDITINYDYAFYRTPRYGFVARFGFNPNLFDNEKENALIFPMTASLLVGQNGALEIGAGGVLADYTEYNYGMVYPYSYSEKRVTRFFPTGIFGFRYQQRDGVFLKMAITPLFIMKRINGGTSWISTYDIGERNIYWTGGINIGFAF
ncbi:MAG TPA: hypothetical protein VI757_10780 [Bacteroidia bacterium]|nr:hypothetical protein [Bacteroidia bacterium]